MTAVRTALRSRVHIDPAQGGADVGFAVLDRLRAEMLHRTGSDELLDVATATQRNQSPRRAP